MTMPRTSFPRFSVSEISTLNRSFAEDVHGYAAGGAEGIGVSEAKLPPGRDTESRALLREGGLAATICLTNEGSILPTAMSAQPTEPDRRVELLSESIRRLAAFQPVTVLLLTGVPGERSTEEARRIVVSGLRELAGVARGAGVRIALEPIHRSISHLFSLVSDLPGAVALLDEVADESIGIIFDTWHLWDSPDVLTHIRKQARRFPAVHVNDWRNPTRGWDDRALPGEGIIDLPAVFGALEAGGYAGGWYDMEIFSTETYEDSLLTLPVDELTRRGKAGFMKAWAARHA
jgi:sugar phosphate isomerase/epimerase